MPHLKKTIDLAGWVAALMLVSSVIWWSADTNARLKNVEEAVRPLPQMQTDVALIKQFLTEKTLTSK